MIDRVLRGYGRVLSNADGRCVPVERPGFSGALVRANRDCRPELFVCAAGRWKSESSERILALHDFLAHVRAQEINYVAVPIASDEGSTLVRVARPFLATGALVAGPRRFLVAARATSGWPLHLGRWPVFTRPLADSEPAGRPTVTPWTCEPAVAPTVLDRIERHRALEADSSGRAPRANCANALAMTEPSRLSRVAFFRV